MRVCQCSKETEREGGNDCQSYFCSLCICKCIADFGEFGGVKEGVRGSGQVRRRYGRGGEWGEKGRGGGKR